METKKYEGFISSLIGLVLLIFLSLSLLGIRGKLNSIFTYMTRHMIKVEQDYIEKEKYEADVGTCSAELENQKALYKRLGKYVDERCVCIEWDDSPDEPPMTKDDICNYPYPMGSYSKIQGNSKLKHWQPMEDKK